MYFIRFKKNLLDGIDEVLVLITHLHFDHVGSLPSFIFYLHYVVNISPVVFFPNDDVDVCLKFVGVSNELYEQFREKNNYYDITDL